MCIDMDGVDARLWSASLGKNISHANGPLATLNRLGILTVKKKTCEVTSLASGAGDGQMVVFGCSGDEAGVQQSSAMGALGRLMPGDGSTNLSRMGFGVHSSQPNLPEPRLVRE